MHNKKHISGVSISGSSRCNLCIVQKVLQWISAGEVVIEICGVAYQPLVRSRCVNVSCNNNCLDTQEVAEGTCRVWLFIYNLRKIERDMIVVHICCQTVSQKAAR